MLTLPGMPPQYATHAEAVRAIVGLSGQNLGGKALKCSWGRHQARKTGPEALPAGIGGGFDYLTLQQQQQISLQQQLAMQQLGYPQGCVALSPFAAYSDCPLICQSFQAAFSSRTISLSRPI